MTTSAPAAGDTPGRRPDSESRWASDTWDHEDAAADCSARVDADWMAGAADRYRGFDGGRHVPPDQLDQLQADALYAERGEAARG